MADYAGVRYARVCQDVHGLAQGCVILDGRVVPSFPSIGRIVALEAGIRHNIAGPFVAEEKIDGYNVRIVRHREQLIAFTRSGWACPFTTDRLPDLAPLESVFEQLPDAVVCAEVAGPENPYIAVSTPGIAADVRLHAFDLMRLDRGAPEPLAARDAVFARHGIPQAPLLGRFSSADLEAVRRIVLELDSRGAEGVVFKPLEAGRRVKYATPTVNFQDLVEDASLLAELPGEFFTGRVVRIAVGVAELGLGARLPAMERRLGRALLEDFERSLAQVRESGAVYRDFAVRVRHEETLDALLEHLRRHSKSVHVKELRRERSGAHHRLVFRKTYVRSTSYLKSLLEGQPMLD